VVADERLLVLGAGPAQLGLLAAARRLGMRVIAADRDPSAPGFRYADRRAIVSVEDEPALERLARAEAADGIVAPGTDRSVAIAARIAERLVLAHPLPADVAGRSVSPQRRREALAAAGVPQPEAELARSLDEVHAATERLGFPCLVRAADRPGADRFVRAPADVPGTAADALADSRADFCLVEAVPPGPRLVVSGFVADGRLHAVTLTERQPDIGVALAYVWGSEDERAEAGAALEAASSAAAALGVVSGPFHAEVVSAAGRASVVEATPRLGGGHDGELGRVAVGVDLNELAARAAVGDAVAAAELAPAPRVGGACVRFLVAPPGELVDVAGLEEAYGLEGVRGIRVYRRPGHVFYELHRAADRAGAVLATGDGREQALERAGRAAELIRFETVSASSLV
jgi:biotin carboxylase